MRTPPALFLLLALLSLFRLQAAEWTVDTLADELDSPAGANLSLREAVRDAAAGDTIRFAPALDGGTIVLTQGTLPVSNLTVDAMSLPSGIVLEPRMTRRALRVGGTVTLRGLRIEGHSSAGTDYRVQGGGIDGGGTLALEDCTVKGCRTNDKGAGIRFSGTISLLRCAIVENKPLSTNTLGGGAVYLDYMSHAGDNATFVNCLIARNESGSDPCGILTGKGSLELIHTTVADNVSRSASTAGVAAWGTLLRIQNSVIANNIISGATGPQQRRDLSLGWNTQVAKGGQNFISSNATVTSQFPAGTLTGTENGPLDPQLSTLLTRGNRTPWMFPLAGSLLINRGTTIAGSPADDQLGIPRANHGQPDLGSVEAREDLFTPEGGEMAAGYIPILQWAALAETSLYTVYLGDSPVTLTNLGTTGIGRWNLPALPLGSTWFWRVDSSTGENIVQGPLLSFTVRNPIIVTKAADERAHEALALPGISLREAVILADRDPDPDVIQFHPDLTGAALPRSNGPLEINTPVKVEGESVSGGANINGAFFRIRAPSEFQNLALENGGLDVAADFTVRNCTITGGRARRGGGIHLQQGLCTLIHCTISGNFSAMEGGGVYCSGGSLLLENSIVAGNRAQEGAPDIFSNAAVSTRGQNLIGNTSGSSLPAGPLAGTGTSPLLAFLAPSGAYQSGTSRHCALLPGSPAIGQAQKLATTPATDQTGNPRPADDGASLGAVEYFSAPIFTIPSHEATEIALDTGLHWNLPGDSYEIFFGTDLESLTSLGTTAGGSLQTPALEENTTYYWYVVSVTDGTATQSAVQNFTTRSEILVSTAIDEDDEVPTSGAGISFREAIGIAETRPGTDRIAFDPSLSNRKITISGFNISIHSECTIDGSNHAERIILDLGMGRRLSVGDGGHVLFRKLDIIGSSRAGVFSELLINGAATLSELNISNHHSNTGAINSLGSLTMDRCAITDNFSNYIGGAYIRGRAKISNCTFARNHAEEAQSIYPEIGSGAISYAGESAELIHCTLVSNSSTEVGGLRVKTAGCVLENCIIAGNDATLQPSHSDLSTVNADYIATRGTNLIGINNDLEMLFPDGSFSGTPEAPLDPVLSPLGRHGGGTWSHVPLPGSPALDAGAVLPGAPASDQRGLPRPLGAGPDLGAVEAFPLAIEMVDTDADGMDDRLEAIHGFIVGAADGLADADGDGSSNADELGNRTDPRGAGDYLRVLGIEPMTLEEGEESPRMRVTWASYPGLSYTVELSSELDFGGEGSRELDAGTAEDFSKTIEVPLQPGRDFLRIRRD